MDTKLAQKRVDNIAAAMGRKGMRQPHAELALLAFGEPQVMMRWKRGVNTGTLMGDEAYEFIHDADVAAAFDKADAFVIAQPTPDQVALNDFMAALGAVIDLGRARGIEADYLNPLVASMKKLAENAITDQRAA